MGLSLSNLLQVLSAFDQQMAPCCLFSCLPALPSLSHSFSVPRPITHTWQMCVTRIDAVTSLKVTSCLPRGTGGKGETGLHCFRLRCSCLSFSLLTHLLGTDPTFYHDIRLTFASMLLGMRKAPLCSVR